MTGFTITGWSKTSEMAYAIEKSVKDVFKVISNIPLEISQKKTYK